MLAAAQASPNLHEELAMYSSDEDSPRVETLVARSLMGDRQGDVS
jgi:hypothetical protein